MRKNFKDMNGKIRRISIGVDIPNQFHYSVGGKFPVYIDNKKIDTYVSDITETENHYLIYTKIGSEVYLWKKIPKNNHTTEEFFID